jgi:hypothetical protein
MLIRPHEKIFLLVFIVSNVSLAAEQAVSQLKRQKSSATRNASAEYGEVSLFDSRQGNPTQASRAEVGRGLKLLASNGGDGTASSSGIGSLPTASTTAPEIIDLRTRSEQMGIDPKKFAKFWEQWDLVNVRYRTSPAEQRFIYANDIAWKTLKAGGNKFKEGAVLGKLGFTVGFDHRFPSSYQATSFSRIQLMKKDSRKYVTDDKNKFSASDAAACHACHKLAADHDFVFSTPVFTSTNRFATAGEAFAKNFKIVNMGSIPKVVSSAIPLDSKAIQSEVLDYEITAFQGTISESMLPVSRLASERSLPVLLRSTDGRGFVFAKKITRPDLNCKIAAAVWVKDMQIIPGQPVAEKPRELIFCDGVFK